MDAIDRVLARYPHLTDDEFVKEHLRSMAILRHVTDRAAAVLGADAPPPATSGGVPPADLVLLDGRILTVDRAIQHRVGAGRARRTIRRRRLQRRDPPAHRGRDARDRGARPDGPARHHRYARPRARCRRARRPCSRSGTFRRLRRCRTGFARKRLAGRRDTWIWTPRTFPTRLREHRFPTRSELDAAAARSSGRRGLRVRVLPEFRGARGRPASRATRPTPPGGAIVKDASGEPTGAAAKRRRPARARSVPRPATPPLDTLEQVHRQYLAAGITSVIERGATLQGFETYTRASQPPAVCIVRSTVTIRVPDATIPAAVERFIEGLPFAFGEGDEWLKAGPLKLVADGGILIGTSFMRKPYGRGGRELYAVGQPRGSRVPDAHAGADQPHAVAIIHRRGWQMVAHVTGDAGVDVVLDGIEAAQQAAPGAGPAAYAHSRLLREP